MSNGPQVNEHMYQAFVNFWIYQDTHAWHYVTWALTIEAAVVGGTFLKKGIFACILLIFGTVILYLLRQLQLKDFGDQMNALRIIDAYHKQSGFPFPKARILSEPISPWKSGRRINNIMALIVFCFNILLFIIHVLYCLANPWITTLLE